MSSALANSLPAPHTLRLRPPIRADYLELATWIPDAEACDRWAGPRLPFPFGGTDLENLLDDDDRLVHALSDELGSFWGFAQRWQEAPPAWHLGRLIIAPAARGHGYGRRLCELLMAEANGTRHTLTLRVRRDNTIAHRLYLDLGFQASEAESTPMAQFMRRLPGALPRR